MVSLVIISELVNWAPLRAKNSWKLAQMSLTPKSWVHDCGEFYSILKGVAIKWMSKLADQTFQITFAVGPK